MPTPERQCAMTGPGDPSTPRHLHRRHLPGRSDPISPATWGAVQPAAPQYISAGYAWIKRLNPALVDARYAL